MQSDSQSRVEMPLRDVCVCVCGDRDVTEKVCLSWKYKKKTVARGDYYYYYYLMNNNDSNNKISS